MTWLKDKFWPWWKKYWKWVLFPVGIIGLILTLVGVIRPPDTVDPDHKDIDDIDDEKDRRIAEANEERDRKLQELAEKHQARLESLSDDQEKELQDLTEKPVEEVVAWFDNLS